jgi:hypothetical protein
VIYVAIWIIVVGWCVVVVHYVQPGEELEAAILIGTLFLIGAGATSFVYLTGG